MSDYDRFPLPVVLCHSPVFSAAITYWTLMVEAMLVVLVWNLRTRPLALVLGVLLHVTAGLNMTLGYFSETMIACYLAFVTPATAATVILWARDRGRRMRSSMARIELRPPEMLDTDTLHPPGVPMARSRRS